MTAGRAVLFAGGTVVISLLGLFLLGQAYMIGLASACIAAVLLVLLATLSLLPALLGFAGEAIDRLHVPGLLQSGGPPPSGGFWYRWSRFIQRRAWLTGTAAALALIALAVPLFSLRLAFTDAGNDPPSLTTRQAYDLLAEGFGPGFNGPLVVAVAMPGPTAAATVDHLRAAIAATPGVAYVVPPQFNRARPAPFSWPTRRRRRKRHRRNGWSGPCAPTSSRRWSAGPGSMPRWEARRPAASTPPHSSAAVCPSSSRRCWRSPSCS